MNKKLLLFVAAGVMVAIVLLLALLRATPLGQMPFIAHAIVVPLLLLAFPMRLYVMFVSGENGHWHPSIFVVLVALSGLLWGLVVERIIRLRKRKPLPSNNTLESSV